MENWLEFVAARYNYWIVIILMMTGLYIVFARGNLVKKVVGLNLFQTSVFIFYITIGKIAGGTAPIYIGGELDHGPVEGGGHDADPDAGLHQAPDGAAQPIADGAAPESLHSKIDNTVDGVAANDLKAALKDLGPADEGAAASLHDGAGLPDAGKISNDMLAGLEKPAAGFDVAPESVNHSAPDAVNSLGDIAHSAGEVIYTNPLPHVLILTAIVVGVATTAVGLALAVRIREAYGTIEEDELEAIDHIAEFGEAGAGAAGGGT